MKLTNKGSRKFTPAVGAWVSAKKKRRRDGITEKDFGIQGQDFVPRVKSRKEANP